MRIEIPDLCVVALVGASGSGKSTFAARHFRPTEVLGSDFFRGLVSDDENDQGATVAAFDSLYYVAGKRLDAGRLTVVDATNVQKMARDRIITLARGQNCHAAAIVLDVPPELCQERNDARPGRSYPPHVVKNHVRDLKRSIRHLKKEGFSFVYVLKGPEEIEAAEIVRQPLWSDRRGETGPFDIVGDVHGCYDELCDLLEKIGYALDRANCIAVPPPDRKAIFLGDLSDRGPKNVDTLRLVMNMTDAETALCILGNHDMKLLRHLRGAKVSQTHGLDRTIAELEAAPPEFREAVKDFLGDLISHYVLDGGRLVVAHAGLKEKYHGRGSATVKNFCLYGETTGETDEFGLPVRLNWAEEYRGSALVVYGHTPSRETQALNNTFCIDTGCVFGGGLTALRYPERETVGVPALRQYYEPARPLDRDDSRQADMLRIEDALGGRRVSTSLHRDVVVHGDNAAAALEVMSRFAADPHWLIYLPPTMSPCETSPLPEYLEHPAEAFGYYARHGVKQVVCERKHMGSRAVAVLCRDAGAAAARFGVQDGSAGLIYTRSGRHFFEESQAEMERTILDRLRTVLDGTGFWERFSTDWVCLDAELMPWSAKARALLVDQYAATGRAGRGGLAAAVAALRRAASLQTHAAPVDATVSGQNVDLAPLLARFEQRRESLDLFTAAYRGYCWPVNSVEDYRLAPFHILATEGRVWNGGTHLEHMAVIRDYMTGVDPLFIATDHILVELEDPESVDLGTRWWLELTASGGEGMVVKPLDFVTRDARGEVLQPAVKCRGREYLRIIYGPEYSFADHLERLKKRSLKKKRRLALSEFALGMESLERFVNKEPLHRVHAPVFAVLALESEPVDPRL